MRAARPSRSRYAGRLQWCCRRDYRRTDGRPINCLLIWDEGARKRGVAGTHAGSRYQSEKPYLNSRHGASGGYSKAFTRFIQGGCMERLRRVIRGWVAAVVVVSVAGLAAAGGGASAIKSPD